MLFECWNLSLVSRAWPISDVYLSGRRTDVSRRCLIGACLSTCVIIMEFQTAKYPLTVSRCNSKLARSNSSNVLKHLYLVVICSDFGVLRCTFLMEQMGEMFAYRIMWHKAFNNISFVGCINMVDHC